MLFSFYGSRPVVPINSPPPEPLPVDMFDRASLPGLLAETVDNSSLLADTFVVKKNGLQYAITTSLDSKLQAYVTRLLQHANTVQSAVVALNPVDGRILAMVNRDTTSASKNLCLRADFPAASLFKIVSAAAALETAGFSPDTSVSFVGGRHTLYRGQLKASRGRHTNQTLFRKAFALSNNAVFGNIGIYELGQEVLATYAQKFLFNTSIPFDLPVTVSRIDIPADEFGLAEIASGFNKRTRISPLHAALLASAVVNGGQIPAPWLVNTVSNGGETLLYRASLDYLNAAIRAQTAADLRILMHDAARYGTSRSTFRKLQQKKTFRNVDFGAKTGTINDTLDQFKYDWLTTYALARDGEKRICLAVLGVHGKKLGVRSTELARAIFDYYFSSI